ncbi:MAG: Y-family DNA polymerase [Gammaproteobacteria bacterium]|nr:Y-family DNA polymerase [Gammaproteobacteria bacterium]
MKSAIYALVDCNNFYASCERVFNPRLKNKPMVILSNNDGCVIARSNEAKAIGIPMGAPYFKYRSLIEQSNTVVFSSNYTLYGDMSARVMDLLSQFTPQYEIYSIDEAFLRLDSLSECDYVAYAAQIKAQVFKCTGIPVSVGIGSTKTLTKVANHVAKKKTINGVFYLHPKNEDEVLANFAVEDVWGIGRKLSEKLKNRGIYTALNLKHASPAQMRKYFSVVVENIVHELNGLSCLLLEAVQPKQSITSSRSFGKKVTEIASLKEAVAGHCRVACEKLRKQKSVTQGIYIFAQTSRHSTTQVFQTHARSINFSTALDDTGLIIQLALTEVEKFFSEGSQYQKAGIILLDIMDKSTLSFDLFTPSPNRDVLMSVLDAINTKFQKNTLFYAAEGIKKDWQMKRERKSPHYTSSWTELAIAYAH